MHLMIPIPLLSVFLFSCAGEEGFQASSEKAYRGQDAQEGAREPTPDPEEVAEAPVLDSEADTEKETVSTPAMVGGTFLVCPAAYSDEEPRINCRFHDSLGQPRAIEGLELSVLIREGAGLEALSFLPRSQKGEFMVDLSGYREDLVLEAHLEGEAFQKSLRYIEVVDQPLVIPVIEEEPDQPEPLAPPEPLPLSIVTQETLFLGDGLVFSSGFNNDNCVSLTPSTPPLPQRNIGFSLPRTALVMIKLRGMCGVSDRMATSSTSLNRVELWRESQRLKSFDIPPAATSLLLPDQVLTAGSYRVRIVAGNPNDPREIDDFFINRVRIDFGEP